MSTPTNAKKLPFDQIDVWRIYDEDGSGYLTDDEPCSNLLPNSLKWEYKGKMLRKTYEVINGVRRVRE